MAIPGKFRPVIACGVFWALMVGAPTAAELVVIVS